ncbi:MAG: imidazolonepropionase [Proteobacteria bacterium]|nr:imidazolonepropionase [Pseudomonadota bacterium]
MSGHGLHFDLLVAAPHIATMADDGYGIVRRGAVGIRGETIEWVGPVHELPPGSSWTQRIDVGGWLLPGLVDCHTHLVYAGNRADEFERRLEGESYADIARGGGGVLATVRATREASLDALIAQSRVRLAALAAEGVTTVEIKTGYGLDPAHELKQLTAAQALGKLCDVDVRTTLLAAHALPPEFAGRADAFIDDVCRRTLPAARFAGVDAVDAFCETIGFTAAQTRKVFAHAERLGLRVKLHADQLSDGGGAALAAEARALSADHLEWASDDGVAAMARAGVVAVLLPGAFYTLRETRLPPVAALRQHGVRIAIATDCNPGTSPATSLLMMLSMACTLFRLTPLEAIAGVTRNAAAALGLADRGMLAPGMRADLVAYAVDLPAELCYRIGANPATHVIRGGRLRGGPG